MKNKTTANLTETWKKSFNKDKEEPKSTVLTLIRKEPITFQLSRFENPDDFDRMRFVINACSRNNDNTFRSVLHVEQTRKGSRLIASDGLRLHVAEISKKIKSGNFKARVSATKEIITLGKPIKGIKFPLWSKAIPEKTKIRGVINLVNSGLGKDRKESENLSLAYKSLVKMTGETINLCFINDLTKNEWEVFCQDTKRKAIVLREKSITPDAKVPLAVILPIQQAA